MRKSLTKLLAASLAVTLGFGVLACNTETTQDETTNAVTTTSDEQTETTLETTEEVTEGEEPNVTEEETPGSTEEPKSTEDGTTTGDPESNDDLGIDNETVFTNAVDNSEVYPLEADKTLKYWTDMDTNVSANFQSLGETPLYQAYMEQTGINIEFLHPGAGQAAEALSLMLTTGEFPDMIETNWTTYSGGPNKAIEEGIILDHTPIFEEYAPNLTAFLNHRPDKDRVIKTDDGQYYAFPFFQEHESLQVAAGIIVRQDWLDDLGLDMPITMDDWYQTLTAFKNEKGANSSLTFTLNRLPWGNWSNPYNVGYDFYIDDSGKVKYGPMEEGYRQWLEEFALWYAEGLIDPDLGTTDSNQVTAKMANGDAGASLGFMASGMGVWTNAGRETDPDYLLAGAPTPVLEAGAPQRFGQFNFGARGAVAITTNSEDVELAARFLDYAFSNEGHILMNFGIEGESFEWDGDYPRYSEELFNDPNGRPPAETLSAFVRATYNGPFVQDRRYIEQYVPSPEQKEAYETWAQTDAAKHLMPPTTPTPDESSEFAEIMGEISAEKDRMLLSYIFGAEDQNSFDQYVERLKDMGIERALEIQNAAVERYNNR